jgi:hypothetical protein
MKDLFLLNNSRNYDLITGKEIPKKIPIKNLKKEKTDNKKIQEIIESIPNLSDHTKLQARMKASVLDFKNNKDYAKKQKELIDFYKNNPNKIRKNNHITLKIGEKNNDILINTDNINEKQSANYIMTYTSKGQFDKFDSNELKNMFIKKGMQAYDFDNKNTYNGKNLNSISFKLKGQDTDKINNIEKELKNENYKIKIRKDDNIKKFNNDNLKKKPSEKYVMTYSSKSKFDKFDSNELKNIFEKKGVHVYDIHDKNTFTGRNLNAVSFKLKGENENKIQSIENDLKKENYKVKIKKDNNFKEKINKNKEEKRFKLMPKEVLKRKGFLRQYAKY